MKIQPNEILNDALAILAAAGVLGALFIIGNKYFGVRAYHSQAPAHMVDVINTLTTEYKVISSVQGRTIWGRDYKRGILMSKSGLLYYYAFYYENGQPVEISVYPEIFETWHVEPAVFDVGTL